MRILADADPQHWFKKMFLLTADGRKVGPGLVKKILQIWNIGYKKTAKT
jgi:hypothetical protein